MKKRAKQFYSENILMSVMGHLVLIAAMITSVAIFVERAETVAPDRIQIMEIDLSNVKITGNDTKLYNTDAPNTKTIDTQKSEPIPAATPESVAAESNKQTDSFVDDNIDKKTQKTAAADNKNNTPDTNAPKKKTVIRVNREALSADGKMTVSVVDALRVAMTRCWVIDNTRPDLSDIRAVAHLKMRPNGTVSDVWFESAARAETDATFAYVLDTIRAAIQTCEPLSMLPRAEYNTWETITLTFYPTSHSVM